MEPPWYFRAKRIGTKPQWTHSLQNHNLVSVRKERTDDSQESSLEEGGGETEEYEWIIKTVAIMF